MTSYETIRITSEGPLAIVTIDREAQRNALSKKVLEELTAAVRQVDHDGKARVACITGAGKAFVAGADISEMVEMSPEQAQGFAQLGGKLGSALEGSAIPWVAAVNGFALGGGCELALACDFIYAADAARFGQPEVKLAVVPGFGGTQRLARRVGVAKAKELCFTGDIIDAAEALRIGLADAVVPGGELLAKVKDLAARIAKNGPLAVAQAKRLVHLGQSMALDAALALEQETFGALFASKDQREGMTAFLAKREPTFTGR